MTPHDQDGTWSIWIWWEGGLAVLLVSSRRCMGMCICVGRGIDEDKYEHRQGMFKLLQ